VFDKEREQLIFTLYDGEIHEINIQDYAEYRRINFSKTTFNIPAAEYVFKRLEDNQRGDREMNIEMMRAEVESYRQKISETNARSTEEIQKFLPSPENIARCLRTPLIADAALEAAEYQQAAVRAQRKVQSISQTVLSNENNVKFFDKQIYKYGVEIHKKYAIPFACIVFILIGAPLGIRARKGSLGVGVAFSVGFFLLYWACLIGGEDLADRKILAPALAMWFPNILIGAFGIFITYRTVKETRFIQWERLPKFLQFLFHNGE
jgi:lipopolysaccharide export system permease protein